MLEFNCPRCKHTVLEEITIHCEVAQQIFGADPILIGDEVVGIGFTYGDQETTYGETERYQCQDCEYILKDVTTAEELYEYLEEHK